MSDERTQLLHGPYETPPLQRGDRVTCELRGDVIITSISTGRISWPCCRALGVRGGSGLLLAGDLIRAVKTESAAAVGYWWGVTHCVVFRWRKVLNVTLTNNDGTQHLLRQSGKASGKEMQTREWTDAERRLRRRRAKRLKLICFANASNEREHGWTASELALLGTLSDEDVAVKIGRSVNAVRVRRMRFGIGSARDRPRREA
jgi:hypothetical protein